MLESLIRQEIQQKGPLSQSRFMELALTHPYYGYYRSQEAIGHDFTTSAEISQIFGELIGAWAVDVYQKLDQPETVSVIELGPGKGTLMADFLRVSKLCESFSQALSLTLVEISPLLKKSQQKAIQVPTTWVEQFDDIPPAQSPCIILANEFFDALPTNCLIRKENRLYERCIDGQEEGLSFTNTPLQEDPGPDQIKEESPAASILMEKISNRLFKQRGIFLCIDYGYEEGSGDSLQALFQGNPSPPLEHIGKADLTCHVDFGKLKEDALSHGLGVLGPISQRHFLKNLGFDLRLEALKQKNPCQKANLEAAAQRLIHPQQMGTLFKVMAVFSPPTLNPIGFTS